MIPSGCLLLFYKLSVVLSAVPLIYEGEDKDDARGPAVADRRRKREQDLHNNRR